MSGQLTCLAPNASPARSDHVHCRWSISDHTGQDLGVLCFRDPRRFGGLWTLPDARALESRWAALGPDALRDDPEQALAQTAESRRAIKAALLDQQVIAGIGNIYADESLFHAGVLPTRPCRTLNNARRRALASAIRQVLQQAVERGGSTLRDFVNGTGAPGSYQHSRMVYGRAGLPCPTCATPLASRVLQQRMTVWCPKCQT